MGREQPLTRTALRAGVGAALVCAMTTFVLAPGLDNFLVSDDWQLLGAVAALRPGEQSRLLSPDTAWFFRPTQWLATIAIYNLTGTAPTLYHFLSLLLHVINIILLGLLTVALVRRVTTFLNATTFTALVMLLFALNWRHHEAVYWYASLNELLALLFRLSGLLAVWKFLQAGRLWWLIASVLFYLLALGSKESALLLVTDVMLLLAFRHVTDAPETRLPLRRAATRGLGILAPFVTVGLFWSLAYSLTASTASGTLSRSGLELWRPMPLEFVLRFVIYLNGLFYGTRILSQRGPVMLIELLIFVVLTVTWWRRRRWLPLFALAWTLVALLPYVLTVPEGISRMPISVLDMGVAGDRYLYPAAAGAALLLVAALDDLAGALAWHWGEQWKPWLVGLLVAGLLIFAGLNAVRLARLEREWAAAGDLTRDVLAQSASVASAYPTDRLVCLVDLPDNLNGKYVLRNGFPEAMWLQHGLGPDRVTAAIRPASLYAPPQHLPRERCATIRRWQDDARQFAPAG